LAFKVNPRLEAIAKAGSPKRSDVVVLRGLVANADQASVDIRADLFGSSAYSVSIGDVISSSENPDGSVSLVVHGDAPVTIQTTAGVLQVAKDNTRPPTQTEIDRCNEQGRNTCIDDRRIAGRTRAEAEAICDSDQIAGIRDAVCSVPAAVRGLRFQAGAYLGAEVVADLFD
jgi:hypothetical protein